MVHYKNMNMNGYSYGSDEYEMNGYSYGSDEYEMGYDSDDETQKQLENIEENKRLLKIKQEKEKEKKEIENSIKLKNELGVVSSFLKWITNDPKKQIVEKLSFEDDDAGWTKIQKVEKNKKEEINVVTKTEICRSVGKGKCMYKNCRFAHSISELNIVECVYGSRCRAIYFDRIKNIYMNDKKKMKICMRIHPNEKKENFYARCIPVTEDEMNITYQYILDFENKNGKFLKDIENKRRFIPCNKSITYEISTQHNMVKACAYGLLKEEKIIKKETIKQVKIIKKETIKQVKIIKKDNTKIEQKISTIQVKINDIENKIKNNIVIINRFSERVDNILCQHKCKSLRSENELLRVNLDSFKNDIERIKNPPPEPKIEEKPKKEIIKKDEPIKKPTIVNKIFNICAKSFRSALGIVSKEPSQFVTETKNEIKEKTKTIMCKSYGKYNCHMGTNCRFAHSLNELKIEKCAYGCRCFDVEFVSGSYVNRKNLKNRVCNRIHPDETIENIHKRIGITEKIINEVSKCKTEIVNKKNSITNVSNSKTVLCISVGKYICNMGFKCRFAHNIKELKILPCKFGFNCFDIESCSGIYRNKNNIKNRICERQHPDETIKNVHMRLGLN